MLISVPSREIAAVRQGQKQASFHKLVSCLLCIGKRTFTRIPVNVSFVPIADIRGSGLDEAGQRASLLCPYEIQANNEGHRSNPKPKSTISRVRISVFCNAQHKI